VSRIKATAAAIFSKLRRDSRGAVSPIFALLLIPLIGVLGFATETGSWYYTQRSMQNAADTAALAAATNGCTAVGCGYVQEAAAAAKQYGFTSAVNNTTVATTYPVTCPSGANTCYKVDITRTLPIYMTKIVGFTGSGALGTGRGQIIRASSVASARMTGGTYCITTLGSGSGGPPNDGIEFKGTPNLDLSGCDIASNSGASCNGNGIGTNVHAYVRTAGKSNKQCGTEVSGSPPSDIYAGLASKIVQPPGCNGAPPATATDIPAQTWSTSQSKCGSIRLTGNVTVDHDITLTISKGGLNLNGKTLSTTGAGHLTIIFTGDYNATTSHIFSGSGTLDFQAPTTGDWAGVAVYQDPSMTQGTFDISNAGSQPTYNITGLLYMPKGAIDIRGAINKHSGGDACIASVAKSLAINGTGSILSKPVSQCMQAGLTLQGTGGQAIRAALVQ
jgi:hypothetical protein